MRIGSVELENNVFLAPMAGITDMPFRVLCREQGCGLMYTEMVSAKGISYGDAKSFRLAEIRGEEKPAAVQIFGSDPFIMAKVAEKLNDSKADIIDINMGCPTPKITKNGEGCPHAGYKPCGKYYKGCSKGIGKTSNRKAKKRVGFIPCKRG